MVVDNGSTDGTLAYLEREGVPHISLPRNTGFAAAVNLGAARVRADAILVLNADTVLEPGAIGRLREALDADRLARRGAAADPPARGRRCRWRRRHRPPLQRRAGSDPRRQGARGRRRRAAGRGSPSRPRGLRRLRRRLPAAAGAVRPARRLRRALLRLLRGRRPERAGADRRLALRLRARGGGLARRQRLLAGRLRQAGRRERPSGRSQQARHPGQVHAGPRPAADRRGRGRVGGAGRAQRRLWATLRGKLSVVRWLPALLGERRRLRREGDPDRARRWLGVEEADEDLLRLVRAHSMGWHRPLAQEPRRAAGEQARGDLDSQRRRPD